MNRTLAIGGVLCAGVSLLHFVVIFIGAPAYRYLGAGERMARGAERGDLQPSVLTFVLTVMFAVWAAYAFAGAGLMRPLPLLRPILFAIGAVFSLRGLVLLPQIVLLANGAVVPLRHLFFSMVSLVIGVAYLVGTSKGSS